LSVDARLSLAVEAEEIVQQVKQAIEAERKKAMSENYKNRYTKHDESSLVQLIEPSYLEQTGQKNNSKLATAKIAEMFNTNRTYISDAQKLKDEAHLQPVKRGVLHAGKIIQPFANVVRNNRNRAGCKNVLKCLQKCVRNVV